MNFWRNIKYFTFHYISDTTLTFQTLWLLNNETDMSVCLSLIKE